MRVGAIDIGSNSIRLLVAEVSRDGRSLTTIARAGEPCRLGRGLATNGSVDPTLADRAASLVTEFAERARALGSERLIAAATAALRSASDGDQVAERIASRSGVPVRILSGDEEARLVYRAVVSGLGAAGGRGACIVFDLGGGSTEVVSGVAAKSGRWNSLRFGAVSLTERFISGNPPTAEETRDLENYVRDQLMHECALMPKETPVLAGVGGTVTVLAMMDRELPAYEPTLLEGWLIERPRLDRLVDRITSATEHDRRRMPAMGEGRADIVVAGALVVRCLMDRFPSKGLVCSTQGLRYGLARIAAEDPSPQV